MSVFQLTQSNVLLCSSVSKDSDDLVTKAITDLFNLF